MAMDWFERIDDGAEGGELLPSLNVVFFWSQVDRVTESAERTPRW
jgi:hypothetical protein